MEQEREASELNPHPTQHGPLPEGWAASMRPSHSFSGESYSALALRASSNRVKTACVGTRRSARVVFLWGTLGARSPPAGVSLILLCLCSLAFFGF